jgi:hypothetical protein
VYVVHNKNNKEFESPIFYSKLELKVIINDFKINFHNMNFFILMINLDHLNGKNNFKWINSGMEIFKEMIET